MKLKNTLNVPKIWKKLLKLTFATMKNIPSSASRNGTKATDPKPYRDDERIVSLREGEYTIHLFLCSGNENYWMDYAVWMGKKMVYEQVGDALFDIPKKDEIELDNGETLEFDIKLV